MRQPDIYASDFLDAALPFSIGPYHFDTHTDRVHAHAFTELSIVLQGTAQHQVGKSCYRVCTGDVFVVQGNDDHAFLDTDRLIVMHLAFLPAMLAHCEAYLRALPGYHALFELEPRYQRHRQYRSHLRLNHFSLQQTRGILDDLMHEYWNKPAGYQAAIQAQFSRLVLFLARCYSEQDTPLSRTLMQLGGVMSYLESSYTQAITLEALAERAQMSPRTLERRFKQGTGMTPVEYLTHLRLQRAMLLLRESNLSMTDIAHAVGFSDSNYFSRQFKRHQGIAPREYRRG